MSGSVNSVIIVGNLGADPDSRMTAAGKKVCTLSIATSEQWTDKAGERQEKTEWHRVIFWDKTAELAERYLTKGRKVYVTGKLQTRSWEDKDGMKRYATEIVGRELVFLDSNKGDGAERDSKPARAPSKPASSQFGGDEDFGDPNL